MVAVLISKQQSAATARLPNVLVPGSSVLLLSNCQQNNEFHAAASSLKRHDDDNVLYLIPMLSEQPFKEAIKSLSGAGGLHEYFTV